MCVRIGITPELELLIDGNKQFRNIFFEGTNGLFKKLAIQGQKPKIMIIACSDSRVDPAMIFNCEPGQLFVVRNVANLIPSYESSECCGSMSAALEFGVCVLGVMHVIILGHSQCGGIESLFKDSDEQGKQNCITRWMAQARSVCNRIKQKPIPLEEKIDRCEKKAVINSLHNLNTFSFVNNQVRAGELNLHAWYFDMTTGRVYRYHEGQGIWET
jgi:carbonic anhydrase